MNLLFRIVYGSACRSTHHKFAMDALRRLPADLQLPWTRAFLLHYQDYLRGAKDPDNRFRDFTNHVVHVGDNYWGGAVAAARKWYDMARTALAQREWDHGIYACGVLSHYLTDPVMPFHTAQSDRETVIHRACEWSITKSYDAIHQITLLRVGYPLIELSHDDDWLDQAVRLGAECGYHYYDDLIEHYQFDRGVKDPPAGLDAYCREMLAKLFGVSIQLWAEVLARLLQEANVQPPTEDLTFPTLFAALDVPQKWVVSKFADAQERELVRSIYDEWKATGTVVKNLPLDDRMVQQAYEDEVLNDEEGRWRGDATPASTPLPVAWHASRESTSESTGRGESQPVFQRPAPPKPVAPRQADRVSETIEPPTPSLLPGAHGVPRPHFATAPKVDRRAETSPAQDRRVDPPTQKDAAKTGPEPKHRPEVSSSTRPEVSLAATPKPQPADRSNSRSRPRN